MRWVRRGNRAQRALGFIVTWDVDSSDRSTCERLRRFVYGETVRARGRIYHYAGFVEQEGVRYLGQSVLFVPWSLLVAIDARLTALGVDHEAVAAAIG